MSTKRVRSGKKIFKKTFTYFIPAPPHRKSGYREIEFDKIMQGLIDSGFDVESLKTVSTESGFLILVLLSTKSKKIYDLDIKQDLHERFRLSDSHSSPDIILEEEDDA